METCSKPPTSYDSVFLVFGILVDVDRWIYMELRPKKNSGNGYEWINDDALEWQVYSNYVNLTLLN